MSGSGKRGEQRTSLDRYETAQRALRVATGARIREIRKQLLIGQAECARDAGIDTSSLFRIEKGNQNLTIDTLARLALSLGVGMDELLIGVVPDAAIVEPRRRS